MTKRSRLITGVVVLSAMMLLPACYTLFRHPRLSQLNYQRPDAKRCQTCHAREDLWTYTHPSTRARQLTPWGDFYDLPWWFESRWQVSDDDTTATGTGP